jgi:hypothetical protein
MPGPTLIKRCSKCQRLIEEETLISGNTCGALFWTDGEYYADMLPDSPELVKCPFCKALLWLVELEEVGDKGINHFDGFVPVKTPGIDLDITRPYKMPNMNDYFRLLKEKIESDEREAYLRLRAWRAGNDKRRKSEHGPARFKKNHGKPLEPLSYPEIKNMKELICILDEQNDDDRLLKAELFRELGFFNQCLGHLAKPLDEYKVSAAFIRELALNKDPWVREIKPEACREGSECPGAYLGGRPGA